MALNGPGLRSYTTPTSRDVLWASPGMTEHIVGHHRVKNTLLGQLCNDSFSFPLRFASRPKQAVTERVHSLPTLRPGGNTRKRRMNVTDPSPPSQLSESCRLKRSYSHSRQQRLHWDAKNMRTPRTACSMDLQRRRSIRLSTRLSSVRLILAISAFRRRHSQPSGSVVHHRRC